MGSVAKKPPCSTSYQREITASFRDLVSRKQQLYADDARVVPPPKKRRTVLIFIQTANTIRNGVESLLSFLLANQKDYLDVHKFYSKYASKMTDAERDAVDREAKTYITDLQTRLKSLRNSIGRKDRSEAASPAHDELMIGIVDGLTRQLDHVARLYVRQKTTRFESNLKLFHSFSSGPSSIVAIDKELAKAKPQNPQEAFVKLEEKRVDEQFVAELHLSPQQVQMLEMETKSIRAHLDDQLNSAKEIERQMAEIMTLQDLLVSKVQEHGEMIESIHEGVVRSIEHVNKGNKLLEEAAKASDFRIFAVLFFITAGFAVLFLHWYD